ncbi:MAG TPA: hypothetical protein VK469_07545 [Candidatus Kapabacteria bacterium]|nr:hypothetical protein [Candidatus Kapabacteria bacterium]
MFIKKNCFFCFVFIFGLTISVFSQAEATTNRPLKYGDMVHILNGYNNWNGGYLDTCNTGCQGNFLCVDTYHIYDRAQGSGTWKILSAVGKREGDYVLPCDNIYLLNQYPYYTTGNGGYLDTRGTGCQGNYLCVSTATSNNRDNGSGTWKIIPDRIHLNPDSCCYIYSGQVVHLLNGYNGFLGGFLDTRGSLGGGNYNVSTCEGWNRDKENTSCWQMLLSK